MAFPDRSCRRVAAGGTEPTRCSWEAGRVMAKFSPVLRGALLVLISATCIAVDTILARIVTQEVNSFVLVFFRNLFGFLFILPWLVRTGRVVFATQRMGLHVARAA